MVPLLPALIFSVGAIAVLLSEVFLGKNPVRHYQPAITSLTCVGAAWASMPMLGAPSRMIFSGTAVADSFSATVSLMVALGLLISTLVAASFLHRHHVERGEFYALSLFAAAGMSLLALSADVLMIFVSLEVMSVAVYALTAYLRRGARPAEAAFKYFLLGAFASALYLYGAALLYGASGSTQLHEIAHAAAGSGLFTVGVIFVATGFAFKVAAVPFHMWTPDVYEGAPTPVTAFMAVGVKAAAFAALLRVVVIAFPGIGGAAPVWGQIIVVLAVLTMLVGNLLAVPQRNVKRMLAYSSVAHAGYLLLGVAAARGGSLTGEAGAGVLFYLFAYTATAAGAFAVVAALERDDPDSLAAWDLDRFAGLASRRPMMAAGMTIFMASLAGIPPLAGFFGKLYIFAAAVDAHLYTAAVMGVLTSVIGAYYYLKVVVYMYMRPPEAHQVVAPTSMPLSAALWIAAAVTVWLGIGPGPLVALAHASAQALGG
ncbi:MAG: NADH-quinone oxidoreductase subunit N [Deltaproteobacteria bacterium]|nr:NADH-quinone oxidoreductase subunit N [Deltaproteobacteria bacterium]